ncbi:hypothetical protein KGM_200555 [Danaus plexippus plexippus]|uniref:Uncharacterized protein n=1 Tax=Danaus plexippus plexippus TaxID=278856 RepID=A0A212EJ81_DANPL|nr:hypothetical protein KGM_200555 [Danaus plexippus plexippus]
MTELVAELEVYKKLDDRKQVKKTSESEGIGPRSRESECSRTDRVLRPALLVETMIRTISPGDPTADRPRTDVNRSKDSLARRYFILSIKHR